MDILISGASTGIGRATAVHLSRLGFGVWAGVRSERSFNEIRKLNVQGLNPIYLDVTDEKSVSQAVSTLKKQTGTLHALVNNAGIVVGGPIEGLSLEDWRRQFETNFFGMISLTKACLPLLRESRGRIVNISSISGRVASPFLSPYAASKFAVEAYSDSLRRELRKHGVRVAIVEPGPIQTPIWQKSRKEGLRVKDKFSEEVLEVYGSAMDKFLKAMEKSERSAAPVAAVVKAIEQALTAREPRTRYPVGRGVGTMALLSGVLPDTWVDQILR